MKVVVQQGRTNHDIELAPREGLKIDALQEAVEDRLGVLKRQQKLIFKGKVLLPHQTLEQAKVQDGSKIMLMATSGPTLGQAAAEKLAKEKAEAARVKSERDKATRERNAARQERQAAKATADAMQERSNLWAKTGIIALRDAGLSELPPQVCEAGPAVQVLDAAGNRLRGIPREFCALASLQKLRLSHNLLHSQGMAADLFSAFPQLQVVAMAHNRLTEVPASICNLPSLRSLDLSSNQISGLPDSISRLTTLQHLNLDDNALEGLPAALGDCSSLVELHVSRNKLATLPAQLSCLQQLRNLHMDDNRLKAVPPQILLHCLRLQTVSLHGNPITMEELREQPAFLEFNERRKAKYSKQMELRLMSPSSGFDEGADDTKSWSATEWK